MGWSPSLPARSADSYMTLRFVGGKVRRVWVTSYLQRLFPESERGQKQHARCSYIGLQTSWAVQSLTTAWWTTGCPAKQDKLFLPFMELGGLAASVLGPSRALSMEVDSGGFSADGPQLEGPIFLLMHQDPGRGISLSASAPQCMIS